MSKTKLKWENFEPHFETWAEAIQPFFLNGGFEPIYEKLRKDSMRGKIICPVSSDTYRCFRATPIDEVKLIMVGMSPYHTLYNKFPVADGLMFGCSITNILQPTLQQFYNAIEQEYSKGLDLHMIKSPDMTYYSDQGILLLNACLTTEANKAGSHLKLWEPFMDFLFKEVLSRLNVPMVFFGKEASKFKKYVPPLVEHFEVSHPASASYKNTDWDSEGLFRKINYALEDGDYKGILWKNLELPF